MGLFDFFRSKSNDSVPVRNKVIQKLSYCGPKYTVARFKIDKSLLPTKTKALLVAQEGHCIDERYLEDWHGYSSYHDIQQALGHGMTLIEKEYSTMLKRKLFLYQLDWIPNNNDDYILAFPATGEEIYFEIYAMDTFNILHLMLHCEL